jgi:hypothetical protein
LPFDLFCDPPPHSIIAEDWISEADHNCFHWDNAMLPSQLMLASVNAVKARAADVTIPWIDWIEA